MVDGLAERLPTKRMVRPVAEMLTGTTMVVDGQEVSTHKATATGNSVSPLMWLTVCDPLLRQLEQAMIEGFCYADDLAFVFESEEQLKRGISIVRRWSRQTGIEINGEKSGVMVIRANRLTPPYQSPIPDIPAVQQYSYLGVTIDDALQFTPLERSVTQKQKTFKRLLAFNWANKLGQ